LRIKPIREAIFRVVATGFGTGYSPVIPGTVGTLVGIPLYMYLGSVGIVCFVLVLLSVIFVGGYAAGYVEQSSGVTDPGTVVIDEIAGYLLTMIGSPADFYHLTAGFFLFRLFDILKPPPVRQAERYFPGGAGIMIDDLLAACYAWLCLRGLEAMFC
jgi:phosphatidylglycerophosphatase A